MWSVMFVKARDTGFIAMIRLSIMYRMMVASSTYRVARLLRSCALARLRIALPPVAANSITLIVT